MQLGQEPPQLVREEGNGSPVGRILPSLVYTSHDPFKELPGGHEIRPTNRGPESQTDGSDVCHDLGDTYPYGAAEDPRPHLPALPARTTAEAPWQRLPPLPPDDNIEGGGRSTDHLLAGISNDRRSFADAARPREKLAIELRKAMVETRPTAGGDGVLLYVPRGALFELVTESSVAAVLQDEGVSRDASQTLAKQICRPSTVMLGGGRKGQIQLSTRRKLFATLVLISKASAIGDFIHEGIFDTHLPLQTRRGNGTWFLSLASRPAERLNCCRDWTADDVEMFDLRQWRLLSPFFADMSGKAKIMHYVLHDKMVPPLHFLNEPDTDMDTGADGGFGTVFRVRFNPHHHNFGPADERENLVLALKRLHSPDRTAFKREVEALKRFSHSGDPHLIKLLWTYEWSDNFYLVFPCAGGNLWDFTEKYANGPELTQDLPRRVWMEWLARQCYGIAAALARIHGAEIPDPDGKGASGASANLNPKQQQPPSDTPARRYGRHGDIKPENILWFPPGKETAGCDMKIGILQVSDFGLSDFHGRHSKSNLLANRFPMSGTYRAPECLTSNRLGQSYDLWTLGCVYIQFVSWFLLGHARTKWGFSKKRLDDERDVEIPEDTFFQVKAETLPVRAFVKPSVLDWVEQLTKHRDCSALLADFLAYILSDILLTAPKKRAKSSEVAKRLHGMLEKCLNDPSYCLERNKSPAPSRSPTFGPDIIYSNDEIEEVMESLVRKGRSLTFPPQPLVVGREPLLRSLSETEGTWGSPTSRLPQVRSSPPPLAPLLRPAPARESGVAELSTKNAGAQQQKAQKEPHGRQDYGTVSGLSGAYAVSTPPGSGLPGRVRASGSGVEVGTTRADLNGTAGRPLHDEEQTTGSIYAMQEVSGARHYIENLTVILLESFPDEHTMSALCGSLPGILRAFALSLGAEDDGAAHKQAMAFINQQRSYITAAVRSCYEKERARQFQERYKANNKISLTEKFRAFQSDASESEGTQDILHGEDATSQAPPDPTRYKRLITGSTSYQWLLERLKRQLTHTPPTHSISKKIWTALTSRERDRHLSGRRGPPVYSLSFRSQWDPWAIIRAQEYGIAPQEAIDRALVINSGPGGLEETEALMCGEYLRRVWPLSGAIFVKLMQQLVTADPGTSCTVTLHDRTRLTAMLQSPFCILDAVGTSGSLVEVGEMFAWIVTAFQAGIGKEVVQMMPTIDITDRPDGSIACTISSRQYGELASKKRNLPGQCWRDLFRNPVVAHGFPVRRRPDKKLLGLEVSLSTMAVVLKTRRLSIFDGSILLKGFCTALVTTKIHGTGEDAFLVWHVVFNEEGNRISFADPQIHKASQQLQSRPGIAEVENARHVIGWCEHVKNYMGAPDVEYDSIRLTSWPNPTAGCVFDRFTLTGGKFITVAMSAVVGRSHKPVRTLGQSDYYKQLQWVQKRYVVFYDVGDRRAWLVNGLSALLHLVRASIMYTRASGVPVLVGDRASEQHLHEAQDAHIGMESAREVLFSERNAELVLYRLPASSLEKTKTPRVGGDEAEEDNTETERKVVRFSDRVEEVYHSLSQIFDKQWADTEDGVNFKMRMPLRPQLEGFDFRNLAELDDPIFPKVGQLDKYGWGWVDFVRSAPVRAITLFGRGFGELLVPASPCAELPITLEPDGTLASSIRLPTPCTKHWRELPKGKDLLAVATSDLKRIADGNDEEGKNQWEAVPGLFWLDPSRNAFASSECGPAEVTGDRTQVFLPTWCQSKMTRKFQSPASIPARGAAVFGTSMILNLRWSDDPNTGTGPVEEKGSAALDVPTARPEQSASSATNSTVSSIRASIRSLFRSSSRTTSISSTSGTGSNARDSRSLRDRLSIHRGKQVEQSQQ